VYKEKKLNHIFGNNLKINRLTIINIMNRVIIALTTLGLIFSCNTKSNNSAKLSPDGVFFPEVEQRSIILGTIDNINEFPNAPRTIELSVDDIAIGIQHTFETKIDLNGKFVFDIPLYHSINTYINYADARFTPFLFVNDTLKMNCKIGKKGYQLGIESVIFDNGHDKFQNQFKDNSQWLYRDKINAFREKMPKDLPIDELKNKYLNFEKELLSEIDMRVKRDSLNNILRDYLTYSASYSIYNEIFQYSRIIKDQNQKQALLSFINDSIVYNSRAMVSSDYNTFQAFYKSFVNQMRGEQIRAKSRAEFVKKSVQLSFTVEKGIWAEYLAASKLSNFASMEEELTQPIIDSLSDLIGNSFSDTYIRQYLLALYSKTGQKIKENENLKLPDYAVLYKLDTLSGEQLFNKIVADNARKVIYIDFWGTWCSPCIEQMPYSQKINDLFKGEDVSFVYLCSRSDAKSWEKAIKNHQINGNHVNLNPLQYEYFKDRFSIVGVPRYMLIDKQGKIVNADAPEPQNDELVTAIMTLLK